MQSNEFQRTDRDKSDDPPDSGVIGDRLRRNRREIVIALVLTAFAAAALAGHFLF